MSHYNVVNKPISSLQKKHNNITVDRTPQLEIPQVIHNSNDTITSEIILTTLHPLAHFRIVFSPSKRWTSMKVQTLYFVQDRYEDKDYARVAASSQHLTRCGEREMARKYTSTRSVQHLTLVRKNTSKITKLATKIDSSRNSNSRKALVVWNTRFTRTQWICAINQRKWRRRLRLWSRCWSSGRFCQRIQILQTVHQPQHNHGQSGHGVKEINHGKVIGNIVVLIWIGFMTASF